MMLLYIYQIKNRSDWYDDGIYIYYFIVNMYYAKYHEEYDSEDITIEDLIVTTNYGDIIFPSDSLKDPNKPVVVGSLKAPINIGQFSIGTKR
jgi:hypothetical protein